MKSKPVITERELLRWMTPEQRKEWRAACKSRGDTFFHLGAPESGCDGTWLPEFDDFWTAAWYGTCFDVLGGEPYVLNWNCDTDGNWEYDARCPLREYTEKDADDDSRQAREAYDEYMRHCLETGDDPLDEITGLYPRKVRERWTLEFKPSILGMILTRARRGRHEWTRPEALPQHVLDYAGVDCRNPARPVATWKPEDVKLTRNGRHTETLERSVPRNPAHVRAHIRRVARRHLARGQA
jgi:hypothetical protein